MISLLVLFEADIIEINVKKENNVIKVNMMITTIIFYYNVRCFLFLSALCSVTFPFLSVFSFLHNFTFICTNCTQMKLEQMLQHNCVTAKLLSSISTLNLTLIPNCCISLWNWIACKTHDILIRYFNQFGKPNAFFYLSKISIIL